VLPTGLSDYLAPLGVAPIVTEILLELGIGCGIILHRGASHWLRVVSSAHEYRENAEECIGWARTARADQEREIFLQIARTWIEAAERLEQSRPPVVSPDPKDTISAK
jgi:hypothetical protein